VGVEPRNAALSHENEFQEMKEYLPKIDKSERGVIAGQTYKNKLYDLSMAVPSNWMLGFFHPQSLVSFHTSDDKAEGRLQVVRLSTTVLTAETLALFYAQEAGFEFLSGRQVLYSAGYGYLGRYQGVSPKGQAMDYRLLTVIRKKKGYVLLIGAPYNQIDSYILDIEQIMRGFKFG
jgi:hypothetical protein